MKSLNMLTAAQGWTVSRERPPIPSLHTSGHKSCPEVISGRPAGDGFGSRGGAGAAGNRAVTPQRVTQATRSLSRVCGFLPTGLRAAGCWPFVHRGCEVVLSAGVPGAVFLPVVDVG